MSSKKLICSAVLLMVAFFAVFSSGCGGSDVEAALEAAKGMADHLLANNVHGFKFGLNGFIDLLVDNESKDNQPKVEESDDPKPAPSENKKTELHVVVYDNVGQNTAGSAVLREANVVVSWTDASGDQKEASGTTSAGAVSFDLGTAKFAADGNGKRVANCTVSVTKSQYLTFSADQQVYEGEQKELRVDLVKNQKASGLICALDAQTNAPISDVSVAIYRGWDASGDVAAIKTDTTSGDGSVVFENFDSGYYTIVMTKDGYIDTRYNETFAEGTHNLSRGYLSKKMPSGQFRVVLSWGVYPSDLDAHLYGKDGNGDEAHVYYAHKIDDIAGEVVSLDRDDVTSYGPETITFEVKEGAKYEYFIHWYAPRGDEYDWSRTEAKVELYRGSRLVDTYTVPPAPDGSKQYRYWRVFKIDNVNSRTGLNTYTSTYENIKTSY